jgi:hypothetical protein
VQTREQTDTLLDKTMAVLTGNLTSSTAQPQNYVEILDSWLTQLSPSENTDDVVAGLEQLKKQLKTDKPNPTQLSETMMVLAEHTRLMGITTGSEGDVPTRLEALSAALRTVAGALKNI